MTEASPPWLRLDRRMLAVNLKWLLPPVASTGIYALWTGGQLTNEPLIRLGILTATFLLVTLAETVQLLTTRYRVTDELFELRKGLLNRQHVSIPLDRIRRVDLTADPVHRLFSLSVLRIGTGQHHGEGSKEIKLAALATPRAAGLRRALLASSGVVDRPEDRKLIAKLDWAWIRYAPLTIWGVLGVAILAGLGFRGLEIIGITPKVAFDYLVSRFGELGIWRAVVLLVLGVVLLGVLGCLLAFVEEWWQYRFERDDDGNFRLHRGLLTTRSLSLDRRRLRGVEVVQPLLARLAGAARVDVLATGMQASDDEHRALKAVTPVIPQAEAHRVAADIVGSDPLLTTGRNLRPHPRAALRRRFVRASLLVLVPLGLLALLGVFVLPELVTVAWIAALVLWPVALLLGADAYRALGHGLTEHYLLTRYGTFARRTVALRRDGVIGWTISRSPTQRYSGLATLWAATAAGKAGAYRIRDAGIADCLQVADAAVPGLLAPFVRRRPVREVKVTAEVAG